METSESIIEAHRAAGREFSADGVKSFVRVQGEGETVLCMHGVPASSFLYRKVLPQLAGEGLRGIAFDLPGLGLAERPEQFDYTWTGLGRWCAGAVDALDVDRFHLVVHDIGGPVGFELAASMPERVRSITILNTFVDAAAFRRPWAMEPFAHRYLGEVWLASMAKPMFRMLMGMIGIQDMDTVSRGELDAWVDLLKREDRGRAFLQMMRGFERTPEKTELYTSVVGDGSRPVQVVWGENDTALRIEREGEYARQTAGTDRITRIPAKHFLQEDQAPAVSTAITAFVSGTQAS